MSGTGLNFRDSEMTCDLNDETFVSRVLRARAAFKEEGPSDNLKRIG
jgi:hypothetical protein